MHVFNGLFTPATDGGVHRSAILLATPDVPFYPNQHNGSKNEILKGISLSKGQIGSLLK